MVLTVILTTVGQVGPGAAADLPVLTLPPVTLSAFAELPPLKTLEVTPALKDSATTVDKAANLKGVMKLLGVQLTAGQKKFLNEHKFLLIPKRATRFKGKMGDGWEWDEMLGMFDEVGGSESVAERRPENARLVTPDVLLHAFHKYFENSLEYLERFDLAPLLRRFLQQAQARALKYRDQSSGKLAARYEVVAAQLTVPLVILENAQWSISYEERLKAGGSEQDLADKPDIAESLEGALQGLGKYQKQFSPEVFRAHDPGDQEHLSGRRGGRIAPLWPVCQGGGGENRLHPVHAPEPLRQNLPLAGLLPGHDVFGEKQLPPGINPRAFLTPSCWPT